MNRTLFTVNQSACPSAEMDRHISSLGLRRLDFEAHNTAGNTIFRVEGAPEAEAENKITRLPYLLKKFGNRDDAVEFLRCLKAIAGEDADQLSQQTVASHYLREMATKGTAVVLKEMALLEMQLNATMPEEPEYLPLTRKTSKPMPHPKPRFYPIFEGELRSIARGVYRKPSNSFDPRMEDLETSIEHLQSQGVEDTDVFFERQEQYAEDGLIGLQMSSFHKPVAVGQLDECEFDKFDLSAAAQGWVNVLMKAYIYSEDDYNLWLQLEALVEGESITFQDLTILREIHATFGSDIHLRTMRTNGLYRGFYTALRKSKDVKDLAAVLKEAYQAKEKGFLSVRAFTLLATAGKLHKERLLSQRDYPLTFLLKREVLANATAVNEESFKARLATLPTQQQQRVWDTVPMQGAALYMLNKIAETTHLPALKREGWRMFGENDKTHPIHQVPSFQQAYIWAALNERKAALAA